MHLTGLGNELRQTLRGLLARPARTTMVIVTLAAGLAATTAIYTVIDGILFRPLPYPDGDRLVALGRVFPDRQWREDAPGLQRLAGTSIPTFRDWKARARSFDRIEAIEVRSMLVSEEGRSPEIVSGADVTVGAFGLLGAEPFLGRLFAPADYEPGAPPVMVVSHGAWQNRYGGNPDLTALEQSGAAIVGVLPPGFRGPETLVPASAEFFRPLDPDAERYAGRGRRSAVILGRLAQGVTLEAARAELTAIQGRLTDEYPNDNIFPDGSRFGAGVNLLQAQVVGGAAGPLAVFFGAAALLLLIAAMNSTNLLLLRGLERSSEVTMRRALGATTGRLVAGLLLESVLLAVAAGLLGIWAATLGVRWFLDYGGLNLPRLADVAISPRVLVTSAVITLGVGLVAGLVPALRLLRHASLLPGTRHAGPATTTASGLRLRSALVTAQLSAALVLAIGAGLLGNSLLRVSQTDLGFNPDELVTFSVPLKLPGTGDVAPWELWNQLGREVSGVPGVDVVGLASDPPMADPSWAPWVRRLGDPENVRFDDVSGMVVSPEYFHALGARLADGRGFTNGDSATSEPVAIVNATFARRHLADAPAIGASLVFRTDDGGRRTRRVVGIVEDIVLTRVEDGARPAVYVPHTQEAWPFGVTALIRSGRGDGTFADELRQAATRFNAAVPVMGFGWMSDRVAVTLAAPRVRTALFVSFAVASVLLSLVGLYGSLSHLVRLRTRELGVRMALGADRRAIARLVLEQGVAVVAVGLAAGALGAAGLARFLQGFLFDLDALDPLTFVGAAAALAAAAFLAMLVPVRRASRVDVATVLRD